MQTEQPEYKTEFVEVFSVENIEWGVFMDEGRPKIMYIPHEIDDGIREAWAKIERSIAAEEERLGHKLIRHLPVFEVVGEDPNQPVLTQGAYWQITVHVSTE